MDRPRPTPRDRLRPVALFAACAVHGVAGETAPPSVGPVELAVGLLLTLAIDWRPAVRLLCLGAPGPAGAPDDPLLRAAVGAFHLLAWPPLLVAAASGSAPSDIVRDLVPVGFLALALILPAGGRADRTLPWLTAGLVVAGAAFALRGALGIRLPPGGGGDDRPPWRDDLLLNDPSVVFAAAAATVAALRCGGVQAAGAGVVAAGLLAALLAVGHRAGAVAILAVAVAAATHPAAGRRIVLLAVAFAAVAAAGGADGGIEAIDGLLRKTAAVGLNARPAEMAAAIATGADGPLGLLLGQGWGAILVSPATGGDPVRYAHGLFVHLVVKGGLIGATAGLVLVAALVAGAPGGDGWRTTPVVHAALAAAAIGLTVHASHKFLSFGLVLAALALARASALERQPEIVYGWPMTDPRPAGPTTPALVAAIVPALAATLVALAAGVVWLRSVEPRHTAVAIVGPAATLSVPGAGDEAGRTPGRGAEDAASGDGPFLRAVELLAGGLPADDLAAHPGLIGSVLGEGRADGRIAAMVAGALATAVGRPRPDRPDADRLRTHLRGRLRIEPTARSGLRRITYRHADPTVAEAVIRLAVAGADGRLRRAALAETDAMIAHLSGPRDDGDVPTERRLALAAVVEDLERRRLVLAAPRSHAVAFVHGPVASVRPDDPDPVVVLVVAALGGFGAGVFVGLVRRRSDR